MRTKQTRRGRIGANKECCLLTLENLATKDGHLAVASSYSDTLNAHVSAVPPIDVLLITCSWSVNMMTTPPSPLFSPSPPSRAVSCDNHWIITAEIVWWPLWCHTLGIKSVESERWGNGYDGRNNNDVQLQVQLLPRLWPLQGLKLGAFSKFSRGRRESVQRYPAWLLEDTKR